jgi:hypothetical protein
VSCHSGKKKVVILSDNDMQKIVHEIFLSRYYRLLAHHRDYVVDTVRSFVVPYNMNALSTSATSLQLILYRALCLKTGHSNVTCR